MTFYSRNNIKFKNRDDKNKCVKVIFKMFKIQAFCFNSKKIFCSLNGSLNILLVIIYFYTFTFNKKNNKKNVSTS